MKRIYVVKNVETGDETPVKAANRQQCVNVVAKGMFEVRIPTQDELLKIGADNAKILEAGS